VSIRTKSNSDLFAVHSENTLFGSPN